MKCRPSVLVVLAITFGFLANEAAAQTAAARQAPSPAPPPVERDDLADSEAAAESLAPYPDAPADENAARQRIWESPDMQRARAWLQERIRMSAPGKAREYEQELASIRGMSAEAMREYVKSFNQRLASLRHGEAAAESARNRAIGEAYHRQEQIREAQLNFNLGQNEAANLFRNRRAAELESQRIADSIRAGRLDRLSTIMQPSYNPFAPSFDPASPNAYTRYAAAVSLPGDLPAGDARNFAVDVVGIDGPGPGTVILQGGGAVPNTPAPSAESSAE